jgi:Rrf2 family protein
VRTISKRTKYGLQAMLALGREYGSKPVLIATLATREHIPLKFLELILLDLKGHGVVESKSGKGGGYRLSRPPSEITVGALVRMLEGPLAPLPCASETAFKPCEECHDVEACGTRLVMREVRDAIARVLDATTLADVMEKVAEVHRKRSAGDILMFDI